MAHTHQAKYSWYNCTQLQAYYYEDKEMLEKQRRAGNLCINVESDIISSKNQMRKIPLSLITRVTKLK